MGKPVRGILALSQIYVHWLGIAVVLLFALALAGASAGAALGLLPWLDLTARIGDTDVANAGMVAQLGFTALGIVLLFYLPGNGRIMRLENSHRLFAVSMDDVARAYRVSHEADRASLFRTGSEFDSVRERIRHLREHPDLGALEPEVLELAAQMSHVSRELANVYSDEKVARARAFLKQRQQEVEHFQDHLAMAKKTVTDLKHWMLQVETEDQLAERQLATLQHDLMALLPQLGFELESEPRDPGEIVVPMRPTKPKSPSQTDR